MTSIIYRCFIIITCAVIFAQCSVQPLSSSEAAKGKLFTLPTVPKSITGTFDRDTFLCSHYWDNLDYNNKKLINNETVTELQFTNFIQLFNKVDSATVKRGCNALFAKANNNKDMLQYFLELTEKYLYNHKDNRYANYCFRAANIKTLDSAREFYWNRLLDLTSKNNPGSKAVDFNFTTANGAKSLHSFATDKKYILVMFNDPECDECQHLKKDITASNIPERCDIIAVYIYDNPETFRASLSSVPSSWTYGYDKDETISENNLYDLYHIPTMYLLDSDKNVVVPDISFKQLSKMFE